DTGYFTAYNQANGVPVWSVSLNSPVRSTALVEGNYVWVIPTMGGRAFKLNAATGATQCSAPIASENGMGANASPMIATPPGGSPTVYFAMNDIGDFNGPVVAVNEANCDVDFSSTPEPKPGTGGVWDFLSYGVNAGGTGLVFFGTADPDSEVYAINAITGKLVWRFQVYNPAPHVFDVGAGVVVSPPGQNGFSAGVVYTANKYGILYALNMSTGAVDWQQQFGSGVGTLATPALSGTNLVVSDSSGNIWDFNAVTGAVEWEQSLGSSHVFDGAAAIVGPSGNQVVVDADLAGDLDVVSLETGTVLYQYSTGSFSAGSPADVDGNIIDDAGNGFLYDFAPGASQAAAPSEAISSPVDQSTFSYSTSSEPVTGTASAAGGVDAVDVYVQKGGTDGTWWDGVSGTWVVAPYPNQATLGSPGDTTTSWNTTFPVPPAGGQFEVFASAVSMGVADSTVGSSQVTPGRSSFTINPAPNAVPILAAPFPWVGPSGAVTVQGSGFAAYESVAISLNGTNLTTVAANKSGRFIGTRVVMPANVPFGPTDLVAVGQTSGRQAVGSIYVTNDWSQLGAGPLHKGTDPNDGVLNRHLSLSPSTALNEAWSFNSGAPLLGSVAVADGFAYFANDDGEIFSVRMETGMPQWTYDLSGAPGVSSTPAVTTTALVLVTSKDGELTALHEFTGALDWRTDVGGEIDGSPAVIGGVAYVGSDSGKVTAVNVATGHVVWSVSLGAPVTSTPAVDSATRVVVAATTSGKVAELRTSNGSTAWSTTVPGSVTAPVVIGQNLAFVGSQNDSLYALSESSGAKVWTYTTAGAITAGVVDDLGKLVVGGADGDIHFLNATTGKATYSIPFAQPIAGMADASDFVVTAGTGGTLLGSKPSYTNPNAWTAQQGDAISAAPTVVNGDVVVPGND
ncbi:MAG: PQQ-binding-like beta-propeller repeat protein, partial [Acidimicrobiales bacterium]